MVRSCPDQGSLTSLPESLPIPLRASLQTLHEDLNPHVSWSGACERSGLTPIRVPSQACRNRHRFRSGLRSRPCTKTWTCMPPGAERVNGPVLPRSGLAHKPAGIVTDSAPGFAQILWTKTWICTPPGAERVNVPVLPRSRLPHEPSGIVTDSAPGFAPDLARRLGPACLLERNV
jgi:hypothetical protein